MNSPSTSKRLPAIALVGILCLGVAGCKNDDPPAAVDPPAGVLKPSDLPGNPTPKALTSDQGVTQFCGSAPEMELQEHSESRFIVEYKLNDQVVVRSYKYTYTNDSPRTEDLTGLRNGIFLCAKNASTAPGDEQFKALPGLPATAAGYHISQQTSTSYRLAERVWYPRGTDSIVSIVVLYQGPKTDKLPVNATDLAAKAAGS